MVLFTVPSSDYELHSTVSSHNPETGFKTVHAVVIAEERENENEVVATADEVRCFFL